MGEIINLFTRKAAGYAPAITRTLQQDHFGFCSEDLLSLLTTAAHFLAHDADYHIFYADKLRTIRGLQRDHILPVHIDMKEFHALAMNADFEGLEKIEKDLLHVISENERQRERWGDSQAEWIRATASVDCVKTSVLQDTTTLLDQAMHEILLRRSECRELVRLAKNNPDDLTEYSIAFIGTQYEAPAEFHLRNLINDRLKSLGLQNQPHLRPI